MFPWWRAQGSSANPALHAEILGAAMEEEGAGGDGAAATAAQL